MTTAIAERSAPRLPQPTRVGQGTAVEQARAVAEVEAAIVVAQRIPRNIDRAERDMRRSCAQKSLAEKAFFAYKRAGNQVKGPSVQLARELARCWGNVQYGITELRRDDEYGQSEMQAWCWDVETNARSSTTFIVPHLRDRTGGPVRLTDMRDIYENNANMGARRLREMIFAILPGWYSEDAVTACYETLAADDSDGATVAERAATMAGRFAAIGVTAAQLAQRLGAPQARWTPHDLAQMSITYRSIMRGEVSKDDEFEPSAERLTGADVTGRKAPEDTAAAEKPQRQARRRRAPAGEPDGGQDSGHAQGQSGGESQCSSGQRGIAMKHFERLGFDDANGDREERLAIAGRLAGVPELGSLSLLTETQAGQLIGKLEKCRDRAALASLLAASGQDSDGEASDA